MTTNHYYIEDFKIINHRDPSKKYYIREVLDAGSDEYTRSELTAQQKLAVISELGLERMTQVLEECYRSSGKSYDARIEAQCAFRLLKSKERK